MEANGGVDRVMVWPEGGGEPLFHILASPRYFSDFLNGDPTGETVYRYEVKSKRPIKEKKKRFFSPTDTQTVLDQQPGNTTWFDSRTGGEKKVGNILSWWGTWANRNGAEPVRDRMIVSGTTNWPVEPGDADIYKRQRRLYMDGELLAEVPKHRANDIIFGAGIALVDGEKEIRVAVRSGSYYELYQFSLSLAKTPHLWTRTTVIYSDIGDAYSRLFAFNSSATKFVFAGDKAPDYYHGVIEVDVPSMTATQVVVDAYERASNDYTERGELDIVPITSTPTDASGSYTLACNDAKTRVFTLTKTSTSTTTLCADYVGDELTYARITKSFTGTYSYNDEIHYSMSGGYTYVPDNTPPGSFGARYESGGATREYSRAENTQITVDVVSPLGNYVAYDHTFVGDTFTYAFTSDLTSYSAGGPEGSVAPTQYDFSHTRARSDRKGFTSSALELFAADLRFGYLAFSLYEFSPSYTMIGGLHTYRMSLLESVRGTLVASTPKYFSGDSETGAPFDYESHPAVGGNFIYDAMNTGFLAAGNYWVDAQTKTYSASVAEYGTTALRFAITGMENAGTHQPRLMAPWDAPWSAQANGYVPADFDHAMMASPNVFSFRHKGKGFVFLSGSIHGGSIKERNAERWRAGPVQTFDAMNGAADFGLTFCKHLELSAEGFDSVDDTDAVVSAMPEGAAPQERSWLSSLVCIPTWSVTK